MKKKLILLCFSTAFSSFSSGRQFRPPAFNICKLRPNLKKCVKKIKLKQIEVKENNSDKEK